VLLESNFTVADVESRTWKTFPVIVRSIVHSEQVNQGALILDSSYSEEVDGSLFVEIVINGAYTWQKLKELRSNLVNDVYTSLLRELSSVFSSAMPHEESNDVEFWEDPSNVMAILQEVVEEALVRAESYARSQRHKNVTRVQVLDHVHAGDTWKRALEFTNERNRAKILKAAYAALVDAGWI
jgi:hypothetical protein